MQLKPKPDLLPWSAGPQGRSGPGRSTGELIARIDPEKHAECIRMLADPWRSVQGIAELLELDPATVAGISLHNVETIQANQSKLRSSHSLIGRMSGEEIINRLCTTPDKIETRDLNILYGTSTDKDMAERGLPTAHIQVTHTLAQDIITPLHDILAQVKSMLSPNPALGPGSVHVPGPTLGPGMGSSPEPRQLNAWVIEAELVPDPIGTVRTSTGSEPKKGLNQAKAISGTKPKA